VLETAVNLVSRRAVIVAAAGNHGDPAAAANPAAAVNPAADIGPKSPVWPAACLGVIAVGALDQDRKRADFSPDVPWVSLLATAVDVTGDYLSGEVIEIENDEAGKPTEVKAVPFKGTAKWSGTSFAAAAVSGKLAAHTIPGVRSAREALNDLLQPGPPLLANGIWFCVPER
jgi:subtilisin family serine protease